MQQKSAARLVDDCGAFLRGFLTGGVGRLSYVWRKRKPLPSSRRTPGADGRVQSLHAGLGLCRFHERRNAECAIGGQSAQLGGRTGARGLGARANI